VDAAYLITKANQVAAFFEPYTEEEAVAGVADHLMKFWEPRMRAALRDLAADADELHGVVKKALADPSFKA
jgi:formate dehydrogenase subunit delta